MSYSSEHRRVSPARESTGSDLYTVLAYDPIAQTCDLASASINQRGTLTAVPISQAFGGAWELQAGHQPQIATTDPSRWGDCQRGPRWGMNLPIQPGDMAKVGYVGESMSDPVIVAFYRWRGDYGIPWVANQVLGHRDNDYTKQTPQDDAEPADRFDILLPTGAWIRSTQSGSWVIATNPVNFAKTWLSLDAEGKIKLKARNSENYTVHFELDAEKEEIRLAAGELDDASYLEFKNGDVVIRAKKDLKVYAQQFKVELAPQSDLAGFALQSLIELQTGVGGAQLLGMASTAAGQLLSGGFSPGEAAGQVFKSPLIEGKTRNLIQDAVLGSNPVAAALSGLSDGMKPGDIASQLTQVLGARSLSGELEKITHRLNLERLSEDLNIPSWIGSQVQELVRNSPIESVLDLVGEMGDRQILTEVVRHVGSMVLDGKTPTGAREALQSALGDLSGGLSERVQELLSKLNSLPLRSVLDGDISGVAARLGSHVLSGNDFMGGAANLFRGIDFDVLGLNEETLASVQRIAGQMERRFSQSPIPGMDAIAQLPNLQSLIGVPREIRSLLPKLPTDLLTQLPDIARNPQQFLESFGGDAIGGLTEQLKELPELLLDNVRNLPESLMSGLGDLNIDSLKGLMADPQAALDAIASGLPGLADALGIGLLRVRSVRQTDLARPLPELGKSLEEWQKAVANVVTQSSEIERWMEYGKLELPDYWGNDA